jgi:DNA invertase Pin-like site-specific DNA recombinase
MDEWLVIEGYPGYTVSCPRHFSGYKPDPALVDRVRELVSSGESYRKVASALGLHRHSVSRIARRLRHA